MREVSSPSQGHHVISMADPAFTPKADIFGQATLADHFQKKFQILHPKSLQSDSRSQSHENITIKHRNTKQTTQMSQKSSFDNRKHSKKHNFEI